MTGYTATTPRPRKVIDPFTGEVIDDLTGTTPVGWGAMPPQAQAVNPFEPVVNPTPIAEPTQVPMDLGGGAPDVQAPDMPLNDSFGGVLAHALFGTPESKLSAEEQGERSDKRAQASAMATSAANDPGEAHMGIPTAGGNSMGGSLSFIMTLMKGMGLAG